MIIKICCVYVRGLIEPPYLYLALLLAVLSQYNRPRMPCIVLQTFFPAIIYALICPGPAIRIDDFGKYCNIVPVNVHAFRVTFLAIKCYNLSLMTVLESFLLSHVSIRVSTCTGVVQVPDFVETKWRLFILHLAIFTMRKKFLPVN